MWVRRQFWSNITIFVQKIPYSIIVFVMVCIKTIDVFNYFILDSHSLRICHCIAVRKKKGGGGITIIYGKVPLSSYVNCLNTPSTVIVRKK